MDCEGCGNPAAVVTRTWWEGDHRHEVCNSKDCGNLKTPWSPDVYFRKPEVIENLGDADHPHGRMVESPRQKARILREQGLREDGDKVRGSREKGVQARREFRLSPEMSKKRDEAVKQAIIKLKKDHNAPVSVPLKMVRRK
jgi:hypothetical protein